MDITVTNNNGTHFTGRLSYDPVTNDNDSLNMVVETLQTHGAMPRWCDASEQWVMDVDDYEWWTNYFADMEEAQRVVCELRAVLRGNPDKLSQFETELNDFCGDVDEEAPYILGVCAEHEARVTKTAYDVFDGMSDTSREEYWSVDLEDVRGSVEAYADAIGAELSDSEIDLICSLFPRYVAQIRAETVIDTHDYYTNYKEPFLSERGQHA